MSSLNKARPAIHTHEGGKASHITPYQALRRSVLACLLWEKSAYEDGQSIADRIVELAKKCKPYEVADLAIEARNKHHLRHVPLLLVRALASVGNTGSMVSHTLREVIQRPDELTEFLAIYWKDGKVPLAKQVKLGLAKAFTKFSAYQLAKYNRDNAIKLRDVFLLVHPEAKDDAQIATFRQLLNGELPVPDTWEVALSTGKDKKATWERLIAENKLGYMALLKNLRNMGQAGVSRELVHQALLKGAATSKALPFRFVSAARACPEMEPSLDVAMQSALEGQHKLTGRTVLLVDVSWSMNEKLSEKSDLKRGDAAGALGALTRGICDDIRVFTFSTKLTEVPARSGMALVDLLVPQRENTELGNCVRRLHDLGVTYDRIIVITDEQTRDTVPSPLPGSKAYMINVSVERNGVGYGNWTKIDGFSEAVIDFIRESEQEPQ